jgi:hypothetical protein
MCVLVGATGKEILQMGKTTDAAEPRKDPLNEPNASIGRPVFEMSQYAVVIQQSLNLLQIPDKKERLTRGQSFNQPDDL